MTPDELIQLIRSGSLATLREALTDLSINNPTSYQEFLTAYINASV